MRNKTKRDKTIFNILFLAPCAVVFFLFVILPLLQAIPYSLWKWDGFSANYEVVGAGNYVKLLGDKNLYIPLKNTLVYTLVYMLGANGIGLFFALALQKSSRYNNVLRTVFFVPFVLSMVLAAFIFSYIYTDVFFSLFGVKSFLGNAKTVNYAIAAIAIWKDAGYCMIIYIAGLNLVPVDYYEAARMEGCGALRSFFRITVPLIVPSFTANVTLILTWGIQSFDYAMAATGGGPGNASETLSIFVYKNIFAYHKAGYGEAAGILLTLFLGVLTAIVTGVLRKQEVEM